jgi:3-oxoacyl-[acyl-carrier-protein] synthase-3
MIAVRNGSGRRARLAALGAYFPERVLTNADLEAMVDTSDEWIFTRTGIRERRIAEPDESTADLAVKAAEDILRNAGITAEEIDVLIVPTATPEYLFPSTAAVVQGRIGATNAAAFDLLAACSGFVYGLAQACALVESGLARNVMVIGAETLTRIADFTDRTTCVLFGDGAAGALVTTGDPDTTTGFLGFELGTDGNGGKDLLLPVGGSRNPPNRPFAREDAFLQMNGREVFKFATRVIADSTTRLLEALELSAQDIDLFVPHQANTRIIDHAVQKLGIDPSKVVVNVDRFGNTSSASVPLALTEARNEGRLKAGDLLLLIAFGGGLTWGSTVVRYEPGPVTA